jgi:hypothetical protein
LLLGAANIPSSNATSASGTPRIFADMALACATTSSDAWNISVPPSRIERSECVPLPDGIFAVSPPMKTMSSGCTPSRSAITCAKLVS